MDEQIMLRELHKLVDITTTATYRIIAESLRASATAFPIDMKINARALIYTMAEMIESAGRMRKPDERG